MSYTARFSEMKDLIKTYLCTFHQYDYVFSKLKIFKAFCIGYEMATFGLFWALIPPNIVQSC